MYVYTNEHKYVWITLFACVAGHSSATSAIAKCNLQFAFAIHNLRVWMLSLMAASMHDWIRIKVGSRLIEVLFQSAPDSGRKWVPRDNVSTPDLIGAFGLWETKKVCN